MSVRFETAKAEAKALEGRLAAEGRHGDAEVVRRLRIAAASSNGTLRVIHRDNQDLRRQLGLPSFLEAHSIPAPEVEE